MKRQRGMAVVMALLLVALAASASAMVLWQQGLWWHQLEADRLRAQMRLWIDAGISWGGAQLKASNVVAGSQSWARPLLLQQQGFRLRASLSDLQARFNLNALGAADGQIDLGRLAQFSGLLSALRLPPALAQNLIEWRGLRAAENTTGLPPPPLRELERWQDLRRVPGYTAEVMTRLAPYVAVLPGDVDAVNVNTAAPLLLKAMLPQVAPGTLAQALSQRDSSYFRDMADFKARLGMQTDLSGLSATSSLFLLNGEVSLGSVRQWFQAQYRTEPGRNRLLWRENGAGSAQGAVPVPNQANTPCGETRCQP
jgi:general secretion pathway protein K